MREQLSMFLKIQKRLINLLLVRHVETNGSEIAFHFSPDDVVRLTCENKVEVKMIMKTVEKNMACFSALS
jgi:hypothetical protein